MAAFDFDGTLLAGDTLLILHRLVRSPWGQLIDGLVLLPALLLWKSGQGSTAWFKQCFLRRVLTPAMQSRSSLRRRQLIEHILAETLWQHLRYSAIERLEWHRRQGHRLVIVSASPRCLLEPIAERLHVELIATETSDPTGPNPLQVLSANCKGAEKTRRLEAWLQQPLHSLDLHAYGDSQGDRELLLAAAHPHWRSFSPAPCPYPTKQGISSWITPFAIVLMLLTLAGILQLHPTDQSSLLRGLDRLPAWLPAILATLALAYLGRYWRWRLLLEAEGIGRWSGKEAWAWFQGFALTATPGKIGELSRVQQLNRDLGYARKALLHAFLAERFCDAIAVLVWLGVLVPGQLQNKFSELSSNLSAITAAALILTAAGITLAWRYLKRWNIQLTSSQVSRACVPATGVSIGIWGLEAMILWLLVQAISPTQSINQGQAISIYLLSGTAGMASLLPGGLGVNEAASTALLTNAGLPTSIALSISILRRMLSVWLITALAALASLVSKKH